MKTEIQPIIVNQLVFCVVSCRKITFRRFIAAGGSKGYPPPKMDFGVPERSAEDRNPAGYSVATVGTNLPGAAVTYIFHNFVSNTILRLGLLASSGWQGKGR